MLRFVFMFYSLLLFTFRSSWLVHWDTVYGPDAHSSSGLMPLRLRTRLGFKAYSRQKTGFLKKAGLVRIL
jgi:hypothetical protein